MTRINSIVGFYSGVVAYVDGSNGAWNCQMEADDISDLYWSVDQAISQLNTANIDTSNSSEWSLTWSDIISQLEFVTTFSWTSTPPVAATRITDVVHHLSLLASYDDGTTRPYSITYENNQRIDHLGTYLADKDDPDNAAEIMVKLQTMLELVSDVGQPVMT